ncbi:capsid maturation protease [Gordonia phage Goib]|uniref:Capsid maturation protease n=2 Tax=Vendettavirus vendetta TaxID=2049886 RepID=A0A166Y3X8_9CAUD|nr:head maturation protease [Gordonia phage Vendetta]YP_009275364.1 head maturation protease [Gordonia phage Splinter]ANA85557.1 capsid maturation protease [Gordonia phage Vendetta]ANA85636.1 capsid maturation protease [Gordonia phage Splinter]WNO25754.1 capsid maturation protease [Gordonia phage Goib]
MKTKAIELAGVKAGPDDGLEEGEFIGYASVFGNKDSYGDVVEPGAFADSLKAWDESGSVIPLYWAHNTSDPDYNIGHVVKSEEDSTGWKVRGKIDLDSPKGPQVYRLIKGRRVGQMSFMYEVVKGERVIPTDEETGEPDYRKAYNSLQELKVHEVSVVQVGANQSTEITAVKELANSIAAKAGRTLSIKNEDALRGAAESLESALEAVKSVLPDVQDEDENDENDDDASGKASAAVRSGDPEPAAAKANPSVSLASARLKVLALKR